MGGGTYRYPKPLMSLETSRSDAGDDEHIQVEVVPYLGKTNGSGFAAIVFLGLWGVRRRRAIKQGETCHSGHARNPTIVPMDSINVYAR